MLNAYEKSQKKEGQDQAGDFEKGLPPINTSEEFNRLVSELGKGMNLGASKPEADRVSSPAFDLLDIAGYNYASGRYTVDPIEHPNRVVVGTETFPYEIAQNWELVEKYPHLIGDFMWTSWDYIGEAGIGAWAYTKDGMGFSKSYPWFLADSGAIDIIGNPNAELGYAQVVWRHIKGPYIGVQPVNHHDVKPWQAGWRGTNAIPSWSWSNCKGNDADIEVYTVDHSIKLFLNGNLVGEQNAENMKAHFVIKYEPGVLEAVTFDANGKETGRSSLKSANESEIRLSVVPEEKEIPAGEICFVNVRLQDGSGIVESNADAKVRIRVDGGELLAFGSANPRTEERFTEGSYTTYFGQAMAVVKSTKKGIICINAEDDTGRKGNCKINVV